MSGLAIPVAHADNLVTNPNFSGGTPTLNGGYGPVPNWTFGNPGGGSNTAAAGGNFLNGPLPSGISTTGFIQAQSDYGTNSASTTLSTSLIAGNTYNFSFYYESALFPFYGYISDFVVSIGDQTLYAILNPPKLSDFTLINGSFVADGSSNVLKFQDSGNTGTIDITGVSVTDATVAVATTPEPSSLVLLGTGALGLAGAVRRRFLKA